MAGWSSPLQEPAVQNRLLRALPAESFDRIRPLFEEVELEAGQRIVTANEPISHVYFPESGLVSVIFNVGGRGVLDTLVVGREGMVSTASVLGVECAPHDVQVRVSGTALRIGAGALHRLLVQSSILHEILMRYVEVVLIWSCQAALVCRRNKLDERLALWLLQALDRLSGSEIAMTHEALALMLGTHRPGITAALHGLERMEALATSRGRITVLDREKLVLVAGEAYGTAESEYRRLIGPFG
ncbi:Crp/Fnr family transcriptional regulator [Methylobacterium sp. ID0610]|uniref:Crp/Fnr family transcriptional regulator n=1 Tax=Methylobacterium carpenticola TaxID=3344827 RepID=UPI0036CDD843